MYPELMVIPMREELTRAGINETRTAEDVDAALAQPGTTMLVVNSICGCAAGKMRPGVRLALSNAANQPDHKITVFAGQDREATERARSYSKAIRPHLPPSPSCATASWSTSCSATSSSRPPPSRSPANRPRLRRVLRQGQRLSTRQTRSE